MFDVRITVKGKEYKKKKPTINDYRHLLTYNEEFKGQTFLTSPEPLDGAIELICEWFGNKFQAKDLEEFELDIIYDTFRNMESNISEVFFGVPLKEAVKQIQSALKKSSLTSSSSETE